VRDLVDENPDLGVRGQFVVDDDLVLVTVTPAVGGPVERSTSDAVADLGLQLLEGSQQVGVRVTPDRLRW